MGVIKTILVKDSGSSPVYIYPKSSSDMIEYNNESVKDKLDRIKSDVPSNAKFSDTTYSLVSSSKDGLISKEDKIKIDTYLKIPQNEGDIGLITYSEKQKINSLHDSDGIESGLMTVNQHNKLQGIKDGANKTIIDAEITDNSTNPVTSKAIYEKLNNKADKNHTHEIDQKSILYTNISGKEAIEVSNLNDCIYTGLYYQTNTLTLNSSSNVKVNKGQYICQVLSDKTENSNNGNIIQMVYIYSGSYAFYTYTRYISIANETKNIGDWQCTQFGVWRYNSGGSSSGNESSSSSGSSSGGGSSSGNESSSSSGSSSGNESSSSGGSSSGNESGTGESSGNESGTGESSTLYLQSGIIKSVALSDNRILTIKMVDGSTKTIDLSSITLSQEQIEKVNNIPNQPKYTDTTYGIATELLDGLMSKEDKKSFNIIISNKSSEEIINLNNYINVAYGNSVGLVPNTSYINEDDTSKYENITPNNLSMTMNKTTSRCLAKISNGICTVNMQLILNSSKNNTSFNILPIICGFPYAPKRYAGSVISCYFTVKSNRPILNSNNKIIKPELYLFSGDNKIYWRYTDENNIVKPDIDYIISNKSSLLYTNNKDIRLYINGSFIIE